MQPSLPSLQAKDPLRLIGNRRYSGQRTVLSKVSEMSIESSRSEDSIDSNRLPVIPCGKQQQLVLIS